MPTDPELPRIQPIKGFDGAALDIGYYLTGDYADVSDASRELPAAMEWLNELRQAYAEERDLAEAELDKAKATAYFDLKGDGEGSYAANYGGKATEEGLKMAVALDPQVRKWKETIASHAAMRGRLSGTIDSLQAKVDLLRSSEATRRTTFDETTPSPRRDRE